MIKMRGFNLVELMIAMALSILLLSGIFSIFLSNKQTFELQKGLSSIQQNSRFIIDALNKDVQNAGYIGCYSLTDMPTKNTLNIDPPPFESDFSESIMGYEGSGSSWSPSASSLPSDVRGVASKEDDILVIRFSNPNDSLPLVKSMPNSSATIFVKRKLTDTPIKDKDILLITDCQKSAVFQVTNYTNSSGGIQHNTGGSVSPGNKTKLLADAGSFSTDSKIVKLNTVVYFVAPSADKNLRGEVVKSLWKKQGKDSPIELVQGVTEFKLRYGEDKNSDGSPNRYAKAGDVSDFLNVSSVSLNLVVNSVNKVDNKLMKKKFNSIFKIRNRGFQQ
jgi:type IV pilus assembly protein PilW